MSKARKKRRAALRRVQSTTEWRYSTLREFMLAIESVTHGWSELHREDKEAIAVMLDGQDSSLELLHYVVSERAKVMRAHRR